MEIHPIVPQLQVLLPKIINSIFISCFTLTSSNLKLIWNFLPRSLTLFDIYVSDSIIPSDPCPLEFQNLPFDLFLPFSWSNSDSDKLTASKLLGLFLSLRDLPASVSIPNQCIDFNPHSRDQWGWRVS